ncbi:hypothetical protein ACJIZ3_014237 [Penstemon smallii]|uniref:F-box domain-containing protein n=1 Tax=Penstemon smallii TaxID=265156 RepID=A0ABD3RJR3_9LAMI
MYSRQIIFDSINFLFFCAMVLQCYTWMVDLYRLIIGNLDDHDATAIDLFTYVPNEVVIDILSRLEVQSVFQCQKVCRNWRKLTSSSQFIELHHRRVAPVILRHYGGSYGTWLSIIDEKSEKKCEMMDLEAFCFLDCCNGLVLMRTPYPSYNYFVTNPLSKGGKITTISSEIQRGIPCGFYFHPLANEHRILFACKSGRCYEYSLYLFGAKMWRRTFNPYFYCGPPRYATTPVTVNRALHWLETGFVVQEWIGEHIGITVFEIISEKFSIKHIPPVQSRGRDQNVRLLVTEDRLYFCHVASEEHVMSIWILEDYVNWCWIQKYNVNLDWDVKKFPMAPYHDKVARCFYKVKVVIIHKDEIKLIWPHRGLFSYHLGNNTIKKIPLKKSKDENLDFQAFGYETYTKSLLTSTTTEL